MPPELPRVQMTVKIPGELHTLMTKAVNEEKYASMSGVVITALENELRATSSNTTVSPENEKELLSITTELQKKSSENEVLLANYQGVQTLLAEKEERIKSMQEQIKVKDSHQEARINDLIDQLRVKDQQLEKKDIHIQNLTETMQSQVLNIHNLISQKAIEAPGSKKPWWRFW
jgi:Arc/MetJ-type ribon-helix-helix transcriptional regulator